MYLLDTNTLVNILRGKPNVLANFNGNQTVPMVFSIISYGELVYGAKKSGDVEANLYKVKQLENYFPVIDVSLEIMDCFGETKTLLSRSGLTVENFDLLIGCTALTMNCTVVTGNVKHFGKIPGLKIVNWL